MRRVRSTSKSVALEELLGEARLEELPAREPGHDVPDPAFPRRAGGERVDRLEATVADVREALEAVDEDLVHVRRAAEHVIDAEALHDALDVRLRLIGDDSRCPASKTSGVKPSPHELVEHVRAVLAAAQQHEAVVVAGARRLHVGDDALQVVRRLEVRFRLLREAVVAAADVADASGVQRRARHGGRESAACRSRRRGSPAAGALGSITTATHSSMPGMRREMRFDLSELDARAADLHLVIAPAEELEPPRRGPAREIARLGTSAPSARAAPAARRGSGTMHEPLRRHFRALEVAAREAVARHVHLADRRRPAPAAAGRRARRSRCSPPACRSAPRARGRRSGS